MYQYPGEDYSNKQVELSDFAVLTGAKVHSTVKNKHYGSYFSQERYNDKYAIISTNPKGIYHRTFIKNKSGLALAIGKDGNEVGILPAVSDYNDEPQACYYPQQVAPKEIAAVLEKKYRERKLVVTSNHYLTRYENLNEYFYQGKFYVRVKARFHNQESKRLSNGIVYQNGDYVWVEVSKIEWQKVYTTNDRELEDYYGKNASFDARLSYMYEPTRVLFAGFTYQGGIKHLNKHFYLEVAQKHNPENYKKAEKTEADEIKELLDKIYNITDKIPHELRNAVLRKIDYLINLYRMDNNIDEGKLTLFPEKGITTSRLHSELANILLTLSKEKDYTSLIDEISKYREMLNNEITELPKNNNSLKSTIETIIYYANKMDDYYKARILENLNTILDKPAKAFAIFLSNELTSSIPSLTLEYQRMPKESLYRELMLYEQEVIKMYEKNETKFDLLKTLTGSKNRGKKESNTESIINITDEVIPKIKNQTLRVELSREFVSIKNKYIDALRKCIKENEDIDEITILFHQELEPFLKKLDAAAKNDVKVESRNNKYDTLEVSLISSIEMIKTFQVPEDFNHTVITSYIKDIIDLIYEYNLDTNTTSRIEKQITDFINNILTTVRNNKENIMNMSDKEFAEMIHKINKDFAGLYIDTSMNIINEVIRINEDKNKEEVLSILEGYRRK